MIVARELVFLAWAIAFEVCDDKGKHATRNWQPGKMGLFSNAEGNAIYLLPVSEPFQVAVPKGKGRHKRIFKLWSAFDTSTAFRFTIPDDAQELSTCGDAASILYLSDKWHGKHTRYIHEFKSERAGETYGKPSGKFGFVRAYCDRPKRPRVFGIMSTKGARLVTARGIVG